MERDDDVGDESDDDDEGTGENLTDPVVPPGLRLVKGVKIDLNQFSI